VLHGRCPFAFGGLCGIGADLFKRAGQDRKNLLFLKKKKQKDFSFILASLEGLGAAQRG
jgi:hypothetical protein